jgi:ribonucleotide reductase beta subunit family protein with ferritin-like domain/putative sterol carrier protein
MGDTLLAEQEEVISYDRLYKLWERNSWSATDIDFTVDAEHWATRFDDHQREAALWNYSLFLVGEEAVARTLTPVLEATSGFQERIFLTTQIVDESRHHVFFDRFMREVAGLGADTRSTLDAVDGYLTWGFRKVFEELDRVTGELHSKPSPELLAQSVALYHVVIEGLLAVPGQHFIQRYCEEQQILPGFLEGITNVSRDESRHIAFGVKFLGELVRESPDCRAAAIEMWAKVLPWTAGVFIPPGHDRSFTESFGFTLEEIYAFGMRSFETKLNRIGINPAEVGLYSSDEMSRPYLERAQRVWTLIDAGVIGDDRAEPKLNPEALQILFDMMAGVANAQVASTMKGPVQFDFTDAGPWHLQFNNGKAEGLPGKAAAKPSLKIEIAASDWAKLATRRLHPFKALASRKLKLHGSPAAKAKLPKLFEFR